MRGLLLIEQLRTNDLLSVDLDAFRVSSSFFADRAI